MLCKLCHLKLSPSTCSTFSDRKCSIRALCRAWQNSKVWPVQDGQANSIVTQTSGQVKWKLRMLEPASMPSRTLRQGAWTSSFRRHAYIPRKLPAIILRVAHLQHPEIFSHPFLWDNLAAGVRELVVAAAWGPLLVRTREMLGYLQSRKDIVVKKAGPKNS